jgi:hypothetical protein
MFRKFYNIGLRSLHAKYDNEIAAALASPMRAPLSSGAQVRVQQILRVLPEIRKNSDFLKQFCDKSGHILKAL